METYSTRSKPSTKIRIAPLGNFKSCLTSAKEPNLYKSSGCTSVSAASFWVTKNKRRSPSMAASTAAIDFSRPTSRLIIIPGKTIIPLSANSGKVMISSVKAIPPLYGNKGERHSPSPFYFYSIII